MTFDRKARILNALHWMGQQAAELDWDWPVNDQREEPS